jgi:hypothetical protein
VEQPRKAPGQLEALLEAAVTPPTAQVAQLLQLLVTLGSGYDSLQIEAKRRRGMPSFRVTCFKAGKLDGNPRTIEAEDEQAAAETICGERLVAAGKPGQLRAQVSPAFKAGLKKMFYARP